MIDILKGCKMFPIKLLKSVCGFVSANNDSSKGIVCSWWVVLSAR